MYEVVKRYGAPLKLLEVAENADCDAALMTPTVGAPVVISVGISPV